MVEDHWVMAEGRSPVAMMSASFFSKRMKTSESKVFW